MGSLINFCIGYACSVYNLCNVSSFLEVRVHIMCIIHVFTFEERLFIGLFLIYSAFYRLSLAILNLIKICSSCKIRNLDLNIPG